MRITSFKLTNLSEPRYGVVVALRQTLANKSIVQIALVVDGKVTLEVQTSINETDEERFDVRVLEALDSAGFPRSTYGFTFERIAVRVKDGSRAVAMIYQELDFKTWASRLFVTFIDSKFETGWGRGVDECYAELQKSGLIIETCANCKNQYYINYGIYDPQLMALCTLETNNESPTSGDVHETVLAWPGTVIVSLNDTCPFWAGKTLQIADGTANGTKTIAR